MIVLLVHERFKLGENFYSAVLKILLVYCKLDTDLQEKSFQLKSGNIVSDTSDFFSR